MKIKWWHILIFFVIVLITAKILHPTKMRTGWMYQQSGKAHEAIKHFQDEYAKDPTNYRALRSMAQAFEFLGKTHKANDYFKELLEIKPSDNNFSEVVRFYIWTEQPKEAMRIYEKWYKFRIDEKKTFKDKRGKKILTDLYSYDLLYQRYTDAIHILKEQERMGIGDTDQIHHDLLTLYEATGNLEETVRELKERLNADSMDGYALKKMMQIAVLSDNTEYVEGILKTNIEKYPENDDNWKRFITFEKSLKKDEEVNKLYLEWIAFEDTRQKRDDYLNWLIVSKQDDKAIELIETMMAEGAPSQSELHKTLIGLYESKGDLNKLLPIYLENFEKDPSDKKNSNSLLYALMDLRQYGEAKRVLITLLSIFPTDQEYIESMIHIYDLEKNQGAAIALLERLTKVNKSPMLLKSLGERYYTVGEKEKSEAIFRKLLHMTPEDPAVYEYLAGMAMEQGQMEESLIYYQQLAELQPNDYEPHYQMAEIYRSLEKPKKADEEFATALALLEATPQDRTTLIAEARIHGLLGEKELSDQEFDRLLEQDPRDIELANLYIDTLIENKSIKKAARLAEDYLASNPTNKTLLRNTSRILAHEQKYDQAKTILKSLRKSYPEDESLDIDYAYLLYEMGDWYRAWPRFTKLAEKYPGNKSIQTTLDELFMLYRPQIVGGFGFRRTGGDNLFGPYVRFLYPFNSEWSFSTFYMLDRNIAHVGTLNPSYVSYTNIVDLSARYTPIRNLTIDLGLMNQFEDSAAAPAPHLLVDWIHSEIGRFTLEATYNKLLDDPVEALYFEGRQSPLIVRYENFLFNERLFVRAAYESRWYRVDSDKMPTNQGDDWGRDDIADVGFDWYVHKKPDIRIGYSFHFSRLHQRYNYVTLIPLIQASDRSDINFGFFHEWNKWLSTDIGGFVGYDPKRNLDFGDLYGFNVTPRIKVSKRLEFLGHYEYSSESLTDNVGTYQYFNAEVLYRF